MILLYWNAVRGGGGISQAEGKNSSFFARLQCSKRREWRFFPRGYEEMERNHDLAGVPRKYVSDMSTEVVGAQYGSHSLRIQA